MAKEDIIGGLALAIQKGEPLEQAMKSFLNAGYKNKDIQEAARILQSSPDTPIPPQQPIFGKISPFNLFNKQQPQQIPTNKPLTPVAKSTKNLMQGKKPLQQVQPTEATQSVSLSQHLEGVQDPSEKPQIQESAQQPVTSQESATPQVSQVQTPKPFQGTPLESHYESPKKGPRSIIVIILSILLLLLILSLLGVFLFKDALIGLFNNLF